MGHLFQDGDAFLTGTGNCILHGRRECFVDARKPDFACIGVPPPKRVKRKADDPQSPVPAVERYIADLSEYFVERGPGSFWIELGQRSDACRKALRGNTMAEACANAAVSHGYCASTITLDHGIWAECSRPRVFLLGFSAGSGGDQAMAWVLEFMQQAISYRSLAPPAPAEPLLGAFDNQPHEDTGRGQFRKQVWAPGPGPGPV